MRISQKRVDPQSGEEVPYEDIVKGFEITPERYVVIEPGELDALAPQKSRTIEIEEFVELAEIDPVYYDHPYYLAPGPGGAKPYRLLHEAMREAGKVAIARVVIRSKESLVAIRPIGDALGMATMIFADEVTSPDQLEEVTETTEVKTTKRELEIAIQLVDSLAAKFEPQKYHDTYRKEVLDLIERKAAGRGDRRPAGARRGRRAGARPDERAEGEPRRGPRPRRATRTAKPPPPANPRAKRPPKKPPPNPAPKKQRLRGASRRGRACRRGARGAKRPRAPSGCAAYEAKRDFAAHPRAAPGRHERADGDGERPPAALRDPGAPRPAPALGSAARARRRARLAGRCRRACPRRPGTTASRPPPRTTRSSTSTSRARYRAASTAPGG